MGQGEKFNIKILDSGGTKLLCGMETSLAAESIESKHGDSVAPDWDDSRGAKVTLCYADGCPPQFLQDLKSH